MVIFLWFHFKRVLIIIHAITLTHWEINVLVQAAIGCKNNRPMLQAVFLKLKSNKICSYAITNSYVCVKYLHGSIRKVHSLRVKWMWVSNCGIMCCRFKYFYCIQKSTVVRKYFFTISWEIWLRKMEHLIQAWDARWILILSVKHLCYEVVYVLERNDPYAQANINSIKLTLDLWLFNKARNLYVTKSNDKSFKLEITTEYR